MQRITNTTTYIWEKSDQSGLSRQTGPVLLSLGMELDATPPGPAVSSHLKSLRFDLCQSVANLCQPRTSEAAEKLAVE